MNKLFIVPSNIFTFSFGNHRPAQAVIFILFPNITIFPINKTAYTHKNSAHHYFLMTSRVFICYYLICIQEMIIIKIRISGELFSEFI